MNRNRKEVVFVITTEAKIEAGDNDLDLNLAGVNVEPRVNPAGGMVVWYKKGRNISVWEGSLQQHEECG